MKKKNGGENLVIFGINEDFFSAGEGIRGTVKDGKVGIFGLVLPIGSYPKVHVTFTWMSQEVSKWLVNGL